MNEAQPDADRLLTRCCRSGKKEILRLERDHQEESGGRQGVSRILHVKHFFTVTFLLAEVGGRLQFVMLKYERTEPGRVKAHGRGLSVYSGL